MNGDIIYIDSYDFDERIEFCVTAVLFYTQWCTQSRGLALDVEQSPDVGSVFAIDVTPTVIIFKNGKIFERITGANPPSAYTDVLNDLIFAQE